MRISLLDDQILIRRAPTTARSTGGLHLPERDQARPMQGTVLATGPGRSPKCGCVQRMPVAVQVGDEVLHTRYTGEEVQIDGAECLILREADVLAVLDP